MMSGHGANPIFINNKEDKDWTSRTIANSLLPMFDNISFLPYPPPPHPHPLQSGRQKRINPYPLYTLEAVKAMT